jgi:DNA ligase (NAD+)
MRELSELDPSFVVPVGGKILDGFVKTKHLVPQWSYDNVFGFDELKRWDERNRRIVESVTPWQYCCELKIDGLKIVLTYQDGKLVTGATRGDGTIGEDITENIRMIKSIPKEISEKRTLVVVGEVWMKKSDLEKINKEREKQDLPLYANPRNLAAGTLRQLDTSIVASRNLQVFCYDVEGGAFKTHEEELLFLKKSGFHVNDKTKIVKTLEEVQKFVDSWIPKRNAEEYAVDGVVIKLNDVSIREVLGHTAKSPRFGVGKLQQKRLLR